MKRKQDPVGQAVDVLLGALARTVGPLDDEDVAAVVAEARAEFARVPVNETSAEALARRVRELAENYYRERSL